MELLNTNHTHKLAKFSNKNTPYIYGQRSRKLQETAIIA